MIGKAGVKGGKDMESYLDELNLSDKDFRKKYGCSREDAKKKRTKTEIQTLYDALCLSEAAFLKKYGYSRDAAKKKGGKGVSSPAGPGIESYYAVDAHLSDQAFLQKYGICRAEAKKVGLKM